MNQRFFVIHAQKRAAKVRIVLFELAFLRYSLPFHPANLCLYPSFYGNPNEIRIREEVAM